MNMNIHNFMHVCKQARVLILNFVDGQKLYTLLQMKGLKS